MKKIFALPIPLDIKRKLGRIKSAKGLTMVDLVKDGMENLVTPLPYIPKGEHLRKILSGLTLRGECVDRLIKLSEEEGKRPVDVAVALLIQQADMFDNEDLNTIEVKDTNAVYVSTTHSNIIDDLAHKWGVTAGGILRCAVRDYLAEEWFVVVWPVIEYQGQGSKEPNRKRYSLRLPPDYALKLAEVAQFKNISVSKVYSVILEAYINAMQGDQGVVNDEW